MFDLFLIFLHKGFMFFLLLFFSLLRGITNNINNALWKSDGGKDKKQRSKSTEYMGFESNIPFGSKPKPSRHIKVVHTSTNVARSVEWKSHCICLHHLAETILAQSVNIPWHLLLFSEVLFHFFLPVPFLFFQFFFLSLGLGQFCFGLIRSRNVQLLHLLLSFCQLTLGVLEWLIYVFAFFLKFFHSFYTCLNDQNGKCINHFKVQQIPQQESKCQAGFSVFARFRLFCGCGMLLHSYISWKCWIELFD